MTKHGAEPEAELFVTFIHDGTRWRAFTWDSPPSHTPQGEVFRLRLPIPTEISGKLLENARMEPYDPSKDMVECGAMFLGPQNDSERCHREAGHGGNHVS